MYLRKRNIGEGLSRKTIGVVVFSRQQRGKSLTTFDWLMFLVLIHSGPFDSGS